MREADDEHPPAAEAVAERGAGEQQHGEGQRVGVDGPLERLQPAAEVGADRGQGGRDDEVVERRP